MNTGRGGSFSQSLNADSQNRDAAIRSCLTSLEGLFSPGDGWDDVDIDEGDEDSFYVSITGMTVLTFGVEG